MPSNSTPTKLSLAHVVRLNFHQKIQANRVYWTKVKINQVKQNY